MKRPRRIISKFLLAVLVTVATLGAYWFGLVPQRWSPLPPLALDEPQPWFLDFRLAALRRDRELCAAVLTAPYIVSSPIDDYAGKDGCGWQNAVRLREAGGAELTVGQLTCGMAAGLAMWMTHDVQPLAEKMLGARVRNVRDMGSYACRNIVGNKAMRNVRSQHASANALDLAAFELTDGRSISVQKDWGRAVPEGEFLAAIHARACRYFRVAIGPEFNAAHRDHFHFDRGLLWRCR